MSGRRQLAAGVRTVGAAVVAVAAPTAATVGAFRATAVAAAEQRWFRRGVWLFARRQRAVLLDERHAEDSGRWADGKLRSDLREQGGGKRLPLLTELGYPFRT